MAKDGDERRVGFDAGAPIDQALRVGDDTVRGIGHVRCEKKLQDKYSIS